MGNITGGQAIFYFLGEFLGAFLGAVLAWLAFKQHFDLEEDAGAKLAVFSTARPSARYGWNLVTEIIGTFVLIFVILISGGTPTEVGPLFVALLVVGIGDSLGGPTGYAINPARDLGPRIAHAILPIKGKGVVGLGLLLGAGRRPAHRRDHRALCCSRPSAPQAPDRRRQGRGLVTAPPHPPPSPHPQSRHHRSGETR